MDRDMLMRRLQAVFRTEVAGIARGLADGVAALEAAAPDDRPRVAATLRRAGHSLKGAARAVDRDDLEAVGDAIETIFSRPAAPIAPPIDPALAALLAAVAAAMAHDGGPAGPDAGPAGDGAAEPPRLAALLPALRAAAGRGGGGGGTVHDAGPHAGDTGGGFAADPSGPTRRHQD
jgi:two-component system chemotaxis sensor kinase CheA